MIDIIIPYVNTTREKWIKLYEEYSLKDGIAYGPSDARDYGTLQYIFRSIEKNCRWVNKVFLVVQDEDQVPEWVNRETVRVVYHGEFIPKELLPTFSPYNIEGFYCMIEDLADLFVDVNDDMFFINKIPVGKYFCNGLPVMTNQMIEGSSYLEGYGPGLGESIDRGMIIERRYGGPEGLYFPFHFPQPHLKLLEKKIITQNYNEIIQIQSVSHLRSVKQISLRETLIDITKRLGRYILDPASIGGWMYDQLHDGEDLSKYDNATVVCFNDSDVVDFEAMQKNLIEYLDGHFPFKSRYEL